MDDDEDDEDDLPVGVDEQFAMPQGLLDAAGIESDEDFDNVPEEVLPIVRRRP